MGRYKNSGNGVGTRGNPQQSLEQENFSNKNQETSKLMPNYQKATIDDRKFTEYSLNMESKSGGKDKAIAYKNALGYDKTNYKSLINQISNQINTGKAKLIGLEHASYGTKYKYDVNVIGPNGNTKTIVVVYQIDKNGNGVPRLITNYIKKKGK